jgi:hypothetical protein
MQQRRADLRSRVKVYLPRRRYDLLPWVVNGKHLVAHFRDAEHGVTGRRSVIEPIGSYIAGCAGGFLLYPDDELVRAEPGCKACRRSVLWQLMSAARDEAA